jgi:tetrathionate reductase subunit B
MSNITSRRSALRTFGGALAGILSFSAAKTAKAVVQKGLVSTGAPAGYDATKHKWLMAFDIDKCIGCGSCVDACKQENNVPPGPTYFRTWIERYIIKKPEPGSGDARGECFVDSPNGGRNGFPASLIPREQILKSFFVPKLCNLCEHSPCVQACPVGATFDTPDGVVLVDPKYCVGCGFCIQACPYGCRFMNPETHTADKCSMCYHRITRNLKPACVEVCPTHARVFGDLKNSGPDDPIQQFISKNKVGGLKTDLGTEPRVIYAGMDKEVR